MPGMSAERRPPRSVRLDARTAELMDFARDAGYRITERVGSGGMGIVYRAIDADGRDVAMKLLRHEIADDPQARKRLAREVAAQRRLMHDGVVRVLDAELESSHAFVVTEFVPGPTLEEAVRRHGPLHPELVRELGLVLGETLLAVHEADVIHRDLKPGNIMLRGAIDEDFAGFDPDGDGLDPVIIDFGIALAAEESRMTSTGLVMGTAAYMDPEVIRTDHATQAGDWWSLAAVLAFAATGRPPFGSGRADAVFFRADRGELDVDDLPVELAEWLRASLQADPKQRLTGREQWERLAGLDLSRPPEPGLGREEARRSKDAAGGGSTERLDPAAMRDGDGEATAVLSAASAVSQADGSAWDTADADPGDTDAWAAPQEGADRTEVLAQHPGDRTEVHGPWEGSADAPRTEALGVAEPRTEALPRMETPTAAMPVMRHAPARPAPSAPGAPQHPGTQQYAHPPQPARPQQPLYGAAPVQPAGPGYAAGPVQPAGPGYAAPPQQGGYGPQQGGYGQPYGPGPAQQIAPPGYGGYPQPFFPVAPRRRLFAWMGHAALVGLAAVAPFISLFMLLGLGALARTWDRLARGSALRQARGEGGGAVTATLSAPFRFLQGLLEVALQALFPLILGVLLGAGIDAVMSLQGRSLPEAGIFAIAMGTTVLLTWVGIGSRTTRDGAHRMLAAATPDRMWSAIIAALMLVLLFAIAMAILSRGGAVDYIPFFNLPRLTSLLIWRG